MIDYENFDYDIYAENIIENAFESGNIFLIQEKLNLSDEEFESLLESICI
ncbi:MAG: hypothetical protein IJ086_14335 [Clostridium sp.]|nr:hypothetical protein [Clostridium sp.]